FHNKDLLPLLPLAVFVLDSGYERRPAVNCSDDLRPGPFFFIPKAIALVFPDLHPVDMRVLIVKTNSSDRIISPFSHNSPPLNTKSNVVHQDAFTLKSETPQAKSGLS